MSTDILFSVSDFVAVCNQTMQGVYPRVHIQGEVSSFRISKNRWVYFDLKDEGASLRFFGSVYQLHHPIEDGMLVTVTGTPQLHPQYGFSVTIQHIQLSGEGTMKRAAGLLAAKLEKEGLFLADRKRFVPYPPRSIGLIASRESAAYSDFIKVLNNRWGGIQIVHADVLVQGESAVETIVRALQTLNTQAELMDVLVITRGGGSQEDLQAFDAEPVVRAIAGSRIPTLVAIGHERDESLAERAADVRASTPSNAAELLVPDRTHEHERLQQSRLLLYERLTLAIESEQTFIGASRQHLLMHLHRVHELASGLIYAKRQLLSSLNPLEILKKGYVLVRHNDVPVQRSARLRPGNEVSLQFHDGSIRAVIRKEQV